MKCVFCDSNDVILIHEHYTFCKDCTAFYTNLIIQKKICNHITDDTVTVLRVPWYKKPREETTYIIEGTCSVCGDEVTADGW